MLKHDFRPAGSKNHTTLLYIYLLSKEKSPWPGPFEREMYFNYVIKLKKENIWKS